MAVEKRKSIFSDLRGPVGPVVCSSWKGIPVVKSRPVINKDAKKSKGQVKQRGSKAHRRMERNTRSGIAVLTENTTR